VVVAGSQALLPNPLIVSVASLLNTPGQYIADLIIHPTSARSMGGFEIGGGLLVIVASAAVIARDSFILSRKVAHEKDGWR
jgi:hypothetical protein